MSAAEELPGWIVDTTVEKFDALTNVARIRAAKLSREQQVFVTVTHKIFFQPGSGRKEAALLRGLGESADKKAAKRVLGFLLEEAIVDEFPGREGTVYKPVRKHKTRMGKILTQLHQSTDPLWKRLKADK